MVSTVSRREVEVLVVGAGPAGATVALNLAPLRQVALVDRRARPGPRIGESLPPAARRLLTDMGLWESFTAEGHSPCYGNRAAWGSAQPVETDFLRDPDGHGWHIDRARFEVWLRAVAVDRGALLLAPARTQSMEWDGRRWRVRLATTAGSIELIARLVIDAAGRAAPVARLAGARRQRHDQLFCSWLYGEANPCGHGAGLTYIEAQEHGWWYTAPVPGGRRVLAFHTDADLPEARAFADPKLLPHRVARDGESGCDSYRVALYARRAVRCHRRAQRRAPSLCGPFVARGGRRRLEFRPALLAGPAERPLFRFGRGGGSRAPPDRRC